MGDHISTPKRDQFEDDEFQTDLFEEDEVPEPIPHVYMTVRYMGPEDAKPSVEARQAFYDALSEMAPSDYANLARVGRAGGSSDVRIAMASFSHALKSFPTWFEEHGLVPKPGFDTSIFVNDALNSMVEQAADGEPFRLRAYPWVYTDDRPSVDIECRIVHPMNKPSSTGDTPTIAQMWTLTELRESAVGLFKNELNDWLESIYDHAEKTGVVGKDARTLERDMRRLVQKQVLRYSPAEIVALEQGSQPSDLGRLDHRFIRQATRRAVEKSINAAADRLGLAVVQLTPGAKPGGSAQERRRSRASSRSRS